MIAYHPHPGRSHEWSHPIPQLAGGRACRVCSQLHPGLPAGPGPSPEEVAVDLEAKVIAEPYRTCPRFDACSVNRCPFDPLIHVRTTDPGDRETKCPLSRRVRRHLFADLPEPAKARLPFGGLYEREFRRSAAAKARLSTLTPEQRARSLGGREKGLAAIKAARLSSTASTQEPETASDPSGEPNPSGQHVTGGEAA